MYSTLFSRKYSPNLTFAFSRSILLAAFLLARSLTSNASDGVVEEIVVTADFFERGVNTTPTSVSVIDVASLQRAGVNHVEELLGRVANVNFTSGASRARFLQIRGIGERGQFSEPLNPSVGLLLDGVDMSGVGTAATLFDVEQVEVLRGPQGTLYGANALAGLVNITSSDPTAELDTRLQFTAGEYDALGVGGVVSAPINDRLGYRIAVQQYNDDGFMNNRFSGSDDTAERDELTIRGKLLWQPSDTSELQLVLGRIDVDNGYDNFSLDNNRNTLSDEPGQDIQQTNFASLRYEQDFNDSLRLVGSMGFAANEIDYGYDEDWAFDGFDAIGYTSTDRYLRDRDSTTLDMRLLGDLPRTRWVVGVYGLNQEVDLRRRYTFLAADFTSEFEIKRLAFYGEITTDLGEFSRLTFGLRGERHKSKYRDSQGVRFKPDDDMVGGKLAFEYDLAAKALIYLSASRGYKAGGFNTDGSLDADLRVFDPEQLWNFELGLKARLLEDRLALRLSVFRMARDDVQVATSESRLRANGSTEFIEFTGNAAAGNNTGLELELDYQATDKLDLFASIGLLHTEYENFVNGAGVDLDGRDQAQAPEYQFFVGAKYRIGAGWYASVDLQGKDDYFFSDSHAIRSDAFELVNAELGYQTDRWQVSLWGKNITDEDYFVRGFFFGNDPRDFYTARGFTQLGDPSRYGVTVTLDW